jgi:two-component system sensor histidine kinase/response regulator
VKLMAMENVVMDVDVLPKKMPGLNIEEALTRVGIPATVFKKILLKFAEVNGDKVASMRQGLQDGRLADVGLVAHALKGASGNIGADLVYAAALAVGVAVKTDAGVEELTRAVDVLSTELEVVLGSLATLREDC